MTIEHADPTARVRAIEEPETVSQPRDTIRNHQHKGDGSYA